MDNIDQQVDQIRINTFQVMRRFRQEFYLSSSDINLTGPQLHLLHVIVQKNPCKASELARSLGVKPSAITPMIDRLMQGGFVNREYSKEDRRVVLISLTDQGREAWSQVKDKQNEKIKAFLSQLETVELEMLSRITEKLAHYTLDQSEPKKGE